MTDQWTVRAATGLAAASGFAVGEDGGREASRENSLPQSFATQNPAPSSEGAVGLLITASAVVGHYTQAKENSLSL